jgi:hypothetical protein
MGAMQTSLFPRAGTFPHRRCKSELSNPSTCDGRSWKTRIHPESRNSKLEGFPLIVNKIKLNENYLFTCLLKFSSPISAILKPAYYRDKRQTLCLFHHFHIWQRYKRAAYTDMQCIPAGMRLQFTFFFIMVDFLTIAVFKLQFES